jgi:hypothetical protein
MDALVSKASMIWLSLHPSPASAASAFKKIRAFQPRRRAASFPSQRRKLLTFVAAQPHNIFLYDNFLRSHDRLRHSGRDESETSTHFKLVEANHRGHVHCESVHRGYYSLTGPSFCFVIRAGRAIPADGLCFRRGLFVLLSPVHDGLRRVQAEVPLTQVVRISRAHSSRPKAIVLAMFDHTAAADVTLHPDVIRITGEHRPILRAEIPYSHRRGGGFGFCGSEFGGIARPSSPLNAL